MANSLQVGGWVENTNRGTVVGEIEGNRDKVETMKHWLSSTGRCDVQTHTMCSDVS
jgi:acylphosphatase